ncbi:hypothetical protein PoB_006560900 [Plakobranchus ocellatus]|uniref:Secreted protein n=1 Tax=Plakobranchus ocellatus TaxID=259542 RepID=A0AAV4D4R3_9GAST|nr:hypothetical protein PoB_006560900 [Plakobranchus ocellatus]
MRSGLAVTGIGFCNGTPHSMVHYVWFILTVNLENHCHSGARITPEVTADQARGGRHLRKQTASNCRVQLNDHRTVKPHACYDS